MMQIIRAGVALLLMTLPALAAEPTIPTAFHGTWRADAGTCETASSDGMHIDAREVMFGETGFFVDLVQQLNEYEAVIVASQPRESTTQGTVRLYLRVSADGKKLSLMEPDGTVTTRYRCERTNSAP